MTTIKTHDSIPKAIGTQRRGRAATMSDTPTCAECPCGCTANEIESRSHCPECQSTGTRRNAASGKQWRYPCGAYWNDYAAYPHIETASGLKALNSQTQHKACVEIARLRSREQELEARCTQLSVHRDRAMKVVQAAEAWAEDRCMKSVDEANLAAALDAFREGQT